VAGARYISNKDGLNLGQPLRSIADGGSRICSDLASRNPSEFGARVSSVRPLLKAWPGYKVVVDGNDIKVEI